MRVCGAAEPMPMGRTESFPPDADRAEEEAVVGEDCVMNAEEVLHCKSSRRSTGNFIFVVVTCMNRICFG